MDGRPATPAMPRASGSASASRRASAGSRPSRASTGRNCAGRTGSDGHSPSQPQPKILSACPSYWRRRPDDTPGPRLIGTGRSSTRPPSTTNSDEAVIKSGSDLSSSTACKVLSIACLLHFLRSLTAALRSRYPPGPFHPFPQPTAAGSSCPFFGRWIAVRPLSRRLYR
jgi:hypothetical protein